jgi:hypothetical protein
MSETYDLLEIKEHIYNQYKSVKQYTSKVTEHSVSKYIYISQCQPVNKKNHFEHVINPTIERSRPRRPLGVVLNQIVKQMDERNKEENDLITHVDLSLSKLKPLSIKWIDDTRNKPSTCCTCVT